MIKHVVAEKSIRFFKATKYIRPITDECHSVENVPHISSNECAFYDGLKISAIHPKMISSSLDQTEGLDKSDDRVNKSNYTPLEETLRPMWKLVRLNQNINFFNE
jgi:hypothetical protein